MQDRHALRSNDIREQNEKLVLHLIYSRRHISQSEIVHLTGLKAPTVFRIFTVLEKAGLIRAEDAVVSDRKGRRPSPYMVVPDAHYVIGVDFWSRSVAIGVFDFTSRVVYQNVIDFPEVIDAEDALNRINALVARAIAESGIPGGRLLGIGVGAPGIIDIESGVVVEYKRIRGMSGCDVQRRMEERFTVPVRVHSNCSVIALGEHRYGDARGKKSLVAFLVRSGLGGAFIHDGRMYVNQNRTAFEVGHFSLMGVDEAAKTTTSPAETLEDYVSEDAIFQRVRLAADVADWQELARRLSEGDSRVTTALENIGRLFAQAVRNVVHLLYPDCVLIVSRSAELSAYLAATLERQSTAGQAAISALAVEYDPLLACRGAADLVFDEYFALPN